MSPGAESRAGITPQAPDPRDQFLCSLISSHHSGMRGLCQTSRASSDLSITVLAALSSTGSMALSLQFLI